MRRLIIHTIVSLLLGLTAAQSFAQNATLPPEPAEFIQALTSRLNKAGSGEEAKKASNVMSTLWATGMTEEEQTSFIAQMNIMLARKYNLTRVGAAYALAFAAVKDEMAYVDIPTEQFFEVTMSCILNIEEKRLRSYLNHLKDYVEAGYMFKRDKFYWQAFQKDPKLLLISVEKEGQSYHAPVIRFTNTQFDYLSYRDSTRIFNTSGDFNLISHSFLGLGGRVTWEKMGLPAEEVFVKFKTYKTNFHYGTITADSAIFHYEELVGRPLVGEFEDKNLGYSNINTANYPAFKSYEGNVVIENFIPNVRYEGGFAIRGIRKFGSAYNEWVDYVPPVTDESDYYADDYSDPGRVEESIQEMYDEFGLSEFQDEENYDDSYYDDYENSATDDDYYNDDYEETDTGEEDWGAGEYPDESGGGLGFPDKVQRHVLAKLELKRGDRYVMKLQGEEFVLGQERMVAKNVEASIYLADTDSLYHPSMDLRYSVEKQEVILKKPRRNQLGRLPYASSYHEFYLYFETIRWDLNSGELHFTAFIDKENKLAAIESFSFFQKSRFDQFRGVMKFNPIGAIYRYALKYPGQMITPDKIVEDYNLPGQRTPLVRVLPLMEGSGYLRYDKKTFEITPTPKLFHWTKSVRDKIDYDAIQLVSKVDTGSHAVMNVDDMSLELRGCPYFSLSDSNYLRVVPQGERVIVNKNRNLEFGGTIAAGKLNFYGHGDEGFSYDYESNKLVCDSIDSMRFILVRNPPRDYVMSPLEKALRNTVFENISGAIHVDGPDNKRGKKKKMGHFPVFDSYTSAYVYWDKEDIQDGVYEKDKMYFALDPFVLDSLDDFDEKNLLFDGEFYSSNIFPPLRQTLVVMEDFTLGFEERAPANGHYIYDKKGLYYNDVTLDGSGLHGDGRIEVYDIDVTVESDSFIFHFDSAMAVIQDFHRDRGFREGNYYPEVDAKTAQYVWYPYEDRVVLRSIGEPLQIFGGEAQFDGMLTIRPEGMIGNGAITLGQIRIESDSILFNEMDFNAPSADFIIQDKEDPQLYHFVAEDVKVNYDVYEHKSIFETKDVEKTLAYFPIHQYRTSMAKGEYVRERNDLKLEGISSYIKDNYFLSVSPQQDSLKFNAKESFYKVDTRSIEVSGVPYIYVADATVTPDKLEVTIEETGLIKRLENAIIEADQETKLHRIYEASIDIFSANEYEGSGKYDYINVKGEEQFILFNNIQVNSDTVTVASGGVPEEQGFFLTERIYFKGASFLNASQKFLEFDGEVKIESENPAFKGAWFEFDRRVVNPDSVFIPIKKGMRDQSSNQLLTVGLNYNPENRFFYSNFLQPMRDDADRILISASGGLTFDRIKKEFRIGSEEKLGGQTYKGSTVSFNDSLNTITSSGLLDFPHDFAKNTAKMRVAGSWKDDLKRRELSTDLLMAIDLSVIPIEPYKKLAENLLYLTASNMDVDYSQQSLLEHISELLDEGNNDDKETRKFIEESKNALVTTDIKLAKLLPSTLLMSNVNFNYSREYKALYSDSDVGLLGMGGEPLNKKVPAKIVYKFGTVGAGGKKAPDKLEIYLEVDEFNWIFFSYSEEVVYVTSSYYDDFNYPLQAEVDKRKKNEGFRFEMTNEDVVAEFKDSFIKKFILNK